MKALLKLDLDERTRAASVTDPDAMLPGLILTWLRAAERAMPLGFFQKRLVTTGFGPERPDPVWVFSIAAASV